MSHEIEDGHCSRTGCSATYRPHRWGEIKAQGEGWFFQRTGEAWCPEHVPDWVEEWRAKRQRQAK